jgi:hypothetical protein
MFGFYIMVFVYLLGHNFLLSFLDSLVLFCFGKGLETSFILSLFASIIIGLYIY